MKRILALLALMALTLGAQAQTISTTLVQQLQSYLTFELKEMADECPNGGCYHAFRSARLQKQLNQAINAAAAGTPLPPVMNAWGIAPIWDVNGIAIPGTGATNTGGTGGAAISGATGHNAR